MKKNILQQVGTREETYTVTVVDVEEITETTIIPAVTHEETIIDIPEYTDELTGEVVPAVTHVEVVVDTPETIIEPAPAVTHEETRIRIVPVMASVTVDMTPEEEAAMLASTPDITEQQISDLKAQLELSDYKAIKYAEGWITEEEYAPIKEARQAIRDEINRLEAALAPPVEEVVEEMEEPVE